MTCKAAELLSVLKAKEAKARGNKNTYKEAIAEVEKMLQGRKKLPVFSIDKGIPERLDGGIAMLMEEHVKKVSPSIASLVDSGKIVLADFEAIADLIKRNGENYSYSVVGENARQARKNGLTKAQNMLMEGSTLEEVKEATGWYIGNDAKWRFELRSDPKPTEQLSKLKIGKSYKLSDLVDYKELFDNYPGIRNLRVDVVTRDTMEGATGEYDPTINVVRLSLPKEYLMNVIGGVKPNLRKVLDTLGHEVQHSIQEIENFARGGNLDSAKAHVKYKYLEKIRQIYDDVVKDIRTTTPELVEAVMRGVDKENAIKELRKVIEEKSRVALQEYYNNKDSAVDKAMNEARKYQLVSKTSRDLAVMIYKNLLGEVEARAMGAKWSGESYDTSKYENLLSVQGRAISSDTVQALYDNENKVVVLNEDALERSKVEGVVYHEVGVHMYADLIADNKDAQDRAVKLLQLGLKSGNEKIRNFFTGVSKRLEEAGEVNNKEEVLAYLIEEGFNTLENHELFNPKDRLDQALDKMRKILPAAVVNLIAEIVTAFVGKMKELTKQDVGKVSKLANGGLSGLTYDLGLQAEYNDIVSMVKKGTEELANKFPNDGTGTKKEKYSSADLDKLRNLIREAEKTTSKKFTEEENLQITALVEYQEESTYPIQNARLVEEVKQKLAAMYPEIEVETVDRLLNEEGAEVTAKAIEGIITYNPSRAGIDTLPHEYAHIYINILEKTTFVSNLLTTIQKRENLSRGQAKEWLADFIGVRYADNVTGVRDDLKETEMSIIRQIWNTIKKFFSKKEDELTKDVMELFKRFYTGVNSDAIRLSPKDGYSLVNVENTFADQRFASDVLNSVTETYPDASLVGSVALATQGDVYRKGKDGVVDLHDIDMQMGVVSDEVKDQLARTLGTKYNVAKIYDFAMPKTKKAHELVSALGKFVPKGARKLAVDLSKKVFALKVKTYIVTPKDTVVTNMVRYNKGSEISRVESYTLERNGKVVGTYKADIVPDGKWKTKIVAEHTTGEKAVVLDLISGQEQRSVDYYSKTMQKYIKVGTADSIFEAKNNMGETPRDKDVMDMTLFRPVKMAKAPELPVTSSAANGDNVVAEVYNNLIKNCP